MTLEQDSFAREESEYEAPPQENPVTEETAWESGETQNPPQENPVTEVTAWESDETQNPPQENSAEERESAPCFPRGVIKRGKGEIRLLGIRKKQKTATEGAGE